MKIISSFSGGKTSAYMTIGLKEKHGDDLIVLFANTGQENEETLNFVNRCDVEFGLNVIWLESVIHHGNKKGSTYSVVDYESADRIGDVFEEMIKKYGIPNVVWKCCTRELKTNPMENWIKDNVSCEFKHAIGIRFDEQKRASKIADKYKIYYPLIEERITKFEINEFWKAQKFNLNLHDYQGNCKTCYQKSTRKLLMIAKENPEHFDFNLKMEEKYGNHGSGDNKRVFFRKNTSAKKLLSMADLDDQQLTIFKMLIDEDENSSCSESCEAFT